MAFLRNLATRVANWINAPIISRLLRLESRVVASETAETQLLLSMQYRLLYATGKLGPLKFTEVGFRVNSQHEEDGILLYIFSLIGTTNKKCVEICAGDGIECNTANLILKHKWSGLLVDGNEANILKAREFYSRHPDTQIWPPIIKQAWITKSNINEIVSAEGFNGDVDLLSVDIDGNDYWLWKELDVIRPRVVVLEFNHLLGPDRSVTVPYSDSFVAEFSSHGSDYAGASLQAFVRLGREKGYRLVGTNEFATNAFFVRNDINHDWLPEIEPRVCFSHPRAIFGMDVRYKNVASKAWVEV
jgi:hypothetical protein